MRIVIFAVVLIGAGSLFGCSSESGALAKAKAEAEAAKAEAAAAKTELALLKARLAGLEDGKIKDQSEENKVMDVGKEFIQLVRGNRSDKAYRLTSAAFQKKMYPLGLPDAPELRKSDPLLTKYPAIMRLEGIQHRQHKLKKSSDGKTYEYFCHAREIDATTLALMKNYVPAYGVHTIETYAEPGKGPWVEFTVTIIQENGAWKVDKLEVDKEVP
jgi:hypothetical protein